MKAVIIDSRVPKKCMENLSSLGFEIIALPPFSALQEPTSAHPDMLIFFAGGKLFCHKDYFKTAAKELSKIADKGYELVLSDECVGSAYPHDILFNAFILGGSLYCRESGTSRLILDFAKKDNIPIHKVKQGYAKCSVCPIGDGAAISSDPSLCQAMTKDGIDVLRISSGSITLTGYDTGFIGGCAGSFGEDIYFLGNIALHPDGKAIEEFCEKYGKRAVSLSDEKLFDAGSLFFI
ncbi:MAG: hypothetical protein IJ038_02715 [Clostridia bacterium]|nr:hypothetical protein [Clostridia bacterium]